MPDPKLQKLVRKTLETLKKNDVAGIVVLSSQDHMEWGIQLEATWTCFRLETHPDGKLALRIRNKKADHTDMEKYKALSTDTIGTLLGFIDVLENFKGMLERMRDAIAETGMEIRHRSTNEGPDLT